MCICLNVRGFAGGWPVQLFCWYLCLGSTTQCLPSPLRTWARESAWCLSSDLDPSRWPFHLLPSLLKYHFITNPIYISNLLDIESTKLNIVDFILTVDWPELIKVNMNYRFSHSLWLSFLNWAKHFSKDWVQISEFIIHSSKLHCFGACVQKSHYGSMSWFSMILSTSSRLLNILLSLFELSLIKICLTYVYMLEL